MKHTRKPKQSFWPDIVERTTFNVSVERPLRVISHQFYERITTRFDMHYGLELGVMLDGVMRRYWQGHTLTIGPGEMWRCGMWEPHGWSVTHVPCRAVVLIIDPSFLIRAGREVSDKINWQASFRAAPADRPRLSRRQRAQARQLARGLFNHKEIGHPRDGSALDRVKLLELILLLPQNLHQPEYHPDETLTHVDQAVQLIFNSQKYISTQTAARHCGLSRNTFAGLFKKTMGLSFAEFALRYRVSRAARAMLANTASAKCIAAEWGFADPSHFARCFRKYHNCSPGAWTRRSHP
ncbi:MAG: helix-turn-helix domain-containing protein [Kiritimatiellia bacterium]|jgi:AraC-like DNA-binding protein